MQKRHKCKKGKNAKKAEMIKKSRKCMFNFKNHAKKTKMQKRENVFSIEIHTKKANTKKIKLILLGVPNLLFFNFQPQNYCKKGKKNAKKSKQKSFYQKSLFLRFFEN